MYNYFKYRDTLVIILIILLFTRIKCVMYIQYVIYLCCIHSYKWKRLQYGVVSKSIMRHKLKTVQIKVEEQQLNMLSIQKEIPRNVPLTCW